MSHHLNYDRLAWVYDALSCAVFGNSIEHSKTTFFEELPAGRTILVVGGGTGSFLPVLLKKCRSSNIIYVDSSLKMIDRARKRIVDDPRVKFVQGRHSDLPQDLKADVILTHFFLDLFDAPRLRECIAVLGRHLQDEGLWIVSDFVRSRNVRQRILLRVMYLFFRLTTSMKTRSLPAWKEEMAHAGYVAMHEQKFANGFIQSILFRTPYSRKT